EEEASPKSRRPGGIMERADERRDRDRDRDRGQDRGDRGDRGRGGRPDRAPGGRPDRPRSFDRPAPRADGPGMRTVPLEEEVLENEDDLGKRIEQEVNLDSSLATRPLEIGRASCRERV